MRNDVSEIFAAGGNGAFRYAGRCRADRIGPPAVELYARGVYRKPGVYSLEAFDPIPYLQLMKETDFHYAVKEYEA